MFKFRFPIWDLYLKKCCKHIKKLNFDEILVEGVPQQCRAIYKKTGIKPILHLHTDLLYNEINYSDKIVESCKKIICVSDYIRQRVLTIEQVDPGKVLTVLNCVDTNMFNCEVCVAQRKAQRGKLGYKEDDFVILFSGRICENKGVGDLVNAYMNLNIPNKKLLLVGGNNFGDSKADEFYKTISEIAALHKDIIMTGFVNHELLPLYISACDIYVSPSRYYEAAPLANLEAICMGVPAVVSDRGGITEYTNRSCTVINVDNNPEKTIKETIEQVFSAGAQCVTELETAKWSSKRFYREIMERLETV